MQISRVSKDDIKVKVDKQVLTISAERKHEEASEGESYRRFERYVGTIFRSVYLPDDVDPDHVSAKFENGVLNLNIAKKKDSQTKQSKLIPIH
jgi:HSP20 family protein